MKRVLSIVLILSVCLSLLVMAVPVGAASADDLNFAISQGEVTVIGCDLYASGMMVIPRTYKGLPVTKIGDSAFENCRGLTSVIIPEGVSAIGDKAFYNCEELNFVTLPEGLVTIGAEAFYGCRLSAVSMPTTVTFIGKSAFDEQYPDYGDYYDPPGLVLYLTDLTAWCNISFGNQEANPMYWGQNVYLNDELLTDLEIPDSVTELNSYAFAGLNSLTSVIVHDGVTRIGSGAFTSCPNLEGIWVDEHNPRYSSDYQGVLFTKDQKELIQAPLYLEHYQIPQGVQVIRQRAFYRGELSTVIIPDSVESIGAFAFAWSDVANVYFCGDIPTMYDGLDSEGRYEYGPFYMSSEPTIHYLTGAKGPSSRYDFCGCEWIDYSCEVRVIQEDHLCLEYTYDNNATCTSDGTERGVCLICGEVVVRTVAGTAEHQLMDVVSNNDASCYRDGTKTGTCIHCGQVLTVTDEGSRQEAHSYGEYSPYYDASCDSDASMYAICASCGAWDVVSIEGTAIEHSFTNYVFEDNATCTSDGTEIAQCDHCRKTHRRRAVGTRAHRYEDGICIFCSQSDPYAGQERAVLTGRLTTFSQGDARLELRSAATGQTLTVSEDRYTKGDLQPGAYTLTVSKPGHVTRTYSLTLGTGENNLDLKLHLTCDVSGDGRVNIGDVAKIYSHVKGSSILTDEYTLLCCDLTGDGRINIGDTARAYTIVKSK